MHPHKSSSRMVVNGFGFFENTKIVFILETPAHSSWPIFQQAWLILGASGNNCGQPSQTQEKNVADCTSVWLRCAAASNASVARSRHRLAIRSINGPCLSASKCSMLMEITAKWHHTNAMYSSYSRFYPQGLHEG